MSPYRSNDFRHNCVTDGCLQDRLPSWEWMRGCFPRPKIMPTDIDGMVEVNGHFLFIEQKGRNAHLPEPQRKAYRRLAQEQNKTVLWLRETEDDDHFEVLIFSCDGPSLGFDRWSIAAIQNWLKQWSTQASSEGGNDQWHCRGFGSTTTGTATRNS